MHITNNAIQKNSPNYDPDKGAKWSVQNLRQYLIAKHGLDEVKAYVFVWLSTYIIIKRRNFARIGREHVSPNGRDFHKKFAKCAKDNH